MLKRCLLVSFLVLAFATAAMASSGSLPSTIQKGALLVFPLVKNSGGYTSPTVYTNIYIGNDSAAPVNVKCYWMDHLQNIEDFYFTITKDQAIVFSTAQSDYGPPFAGDDNGSLVCWAQDGNDQYPVRNNNLYGHAMIVNTVDAANVFYNAFSFNLRAGWSYTEDQAAGWVRVALDGNTNYDACPNYLITNFIPDGAAAMDWEGNQGVLTDPTPEIAIWPCRQQLYQDRTPTYTKLKFDVWNWNEVKFTGSYKCIKCFYEGALINIDTDQPYGSKYTAAGYGAEKFLASVLGDDYAVARLRVQAVASTQCANTGRAMGLLGLLLYREGTGLDPVAGYPFHGAGISNNGEIYFDYNSGYSDSAAR